MVVASSARGGANVVPLMCWKVGGIIIILAVVTKTMQTKTHVHINTLGFPVNVILEEEDTCDGNNATATVVVVATSRPRL